MATIIRFPRALVGRALPRANLVRVLADEGDELCFQVRLDKNDLRSVLTHVIEEDRESMLVGVNVGKDTLRRYASVFAVLLGCGGA